MTGTEQFQRDTKTWYQGKDPMSLVSENIISFIKKRAGKRLLDFGCGLGGYSKRLNQLGFTCTALDSNPSYIQIAKSLGVDARLQAVEKIDFPDNYFDTTIMVEVIEHLEQPEPILSEIKRVTKNNVIITSPNCTETPILQSYGLTFEHMLELDHKQFFTVSSLETILKNIFVKVTVSEKEPLGIPFFRLFGPKIYFRLYAVAEKNAP